MAKCIRCGGSFLTRFKIKLKDAYICGKCAEELGLEKDFYKRSSLYSYEELKDGWDAYLDNRQKKKEADKIKAMVSVAHYGEERDLICTEEERLIFEHIKVMFEELGLSSSQLKLVRVSDGYVTAKVEPWDIARIKYTNRAKWVFFPTSEKEKVNITSPDDVETLKDQLTRTVEIIDKYDKGKLHRQD